MKTVLIIIAVLIVLRIATKPKTILLEYHAEKFQALSSSDFTFKMYYEKQRFFGLIKYKKVGNYTIPGHANIDTYTKLWDDLITTKKPLK